MELAGCNRALLFLKEDIVVLLWFLPNALYMHIIQGLCLFVTI